MNFIGILRCIVPAVFGLGSTGARGTIRPTIPTMSQAIGRQLEAINRHFDVLVVIWVLALALGFSLVTIARSDASPDQWSIPAAHSGAAWDYPTTGGPSN